MDFLKEFELDVQNINTLQEVENVKVKFFGKKGILTNEMKLLQNLSLEQKKEQGYKLNLLKNKMVALVEEKEKILFKKEQLEKYSKEKLDLSLPGRAKKKGSLHPITMVINEVKEIFTKMGFAVVDGPEIESVFRNFDALNVSDAHPSRALSDTFYMNDGSVLRTQTTTVQIRCLEQKRLPIVAISYGKVYRPDYDATHTPMFHQLEGIFLTKEANMANLKAVLNEMINIMFPHVRTRFRPHFFPFTEPSAELDMGCPSCLGVGCTLCKHSGWIEMLGCGMVSPEVLKHFGYSLEDCQGFAFGMGIERLAMIKYSLQDIRIFYDNDLRLFDK